ARRERPEDALHQRGLVDRLRFEGEPAPGDDEVAQTVLADGDEVAGPAQPGDEAVVLALGREGAQSPLVGRGPACELRVPQVLDDGKAVRSRGEDLRRIG